MFGTVPCGPEYWTERTEPTGVVLIGRPHGGGGGRGGWVGQEGHLRTGDGGQKRPFLRASFMDSPSTSA